MRLKSVRHYRNLKIYNKIIKIPTKRDSTPDFCMTITIHLLKTRENYREISLLTYNNETSNENNHREVIIILLTSVGRFVNPWICEAESASGFLPPHRSLCMSFSLRNLYNFISYNAGRGFSQLIKYFLSPLFHLKTVFLMKQIADLMEEIRNVPETIQ